MNDDDFHIVFRKNKSFFVTMLGKKEDAYNFFHFLNKKPDLSSVDWLDNIHKNSNSSLFSIKTNPNINPISDSNINMSSSGLVYLDYYNKLLFVCLNKKQLENTEIKAPDFYNINKVFEFPALPQGMLECGHTIMEQSIHLNFEEMKVWKRAIHQRNKIVYDFSLKDFIGSESLLKKIQLFEKANEKAVLLHDKIKVSIKSKKPVL